MTDKVTQHNSHITKILAQVEIKLSQAQIKEITLEMEIKPDSTTIKDSILITLEILHCQTETDRNLVTQLIKVEILHILDFDH